MLLPDNRMRADYKLWPGVPLVIGDVVVGLEPDPLLTFGQEAVVARLPFTVLHHCRGGRDGQGGGLRKVHTEGGLKQKWAGMDPYEHAWSVREFIHLNIVNIELINIYIYMSICVSFKCMYHIFIQLIYKVSK